MSNKSSLCDKGLFYSEPNLNHLRRGIDALIAGRGTEHELIEDTSFEEDACNEADSKEKKKLDKQHLL